MENRGQAKVLGFMLVILILGFALFVYSLPEETEISREYTPSSLKICKGGTCSLTLYSGIKYINEDKVWKDRKDTKSFKNSGIECVVDSDGKNIAECLDWNETSRTVKLSRVETGSVPLRKYNLELNISTKKLDRVYEKEFEISLPFSKLSDDYTFTLKAKPNEILEFGEHSTTIKLQEENLDDALVYEGAPGTNWGNDYYIHVQSQSGADKRVYITFNQTAILPGQKINNATLYLYMWTVSDQGNFPRTYKVYHVYENWTESIITWANQPCGTAFDNNIACNLTAMDTQTQLTNINEWRKFLVTDVVKTQYNKGAWNVSLVIKDDNEDGAGDGCYFYSKEEGTASTRPYLNITYSISNQPPFINLQAPANNTELTPGSIEFVYNVSDKDGDDVDNCSLWLNNGTGFIEGTPDTSITQVINQSFTKSLTKGNYTWKISCYDNFTKPNQGNSTTYALIITGINHAPTIDVPSISPDPAYTDSQLQCSVKAYDIDLDSIIIKFDWYNNSVYTFTENITTDNGTLTTHYLPSGLQAKDEEWNCTIRAFDGQNYSSYESDNIIISNTAPTHDDPVLSSTSVYNASNEDLTCYNQNTQDIDNDEVVNIYSWYLDSNPLAVLNLPFEINADDYSGSGNDGTIVGASPTDGKDGNGNALEFDGIDDKVTVGDLGIPANGPATIEGWFKFKQFAQGSSHKGLYSILYQHSGDNNLYIPGTNELFYVASYLNLNVWHHIVLTYNGDSSTAKLYIDNSEYNVAVQGEGQTIPALDNFLVGDRGYDLFFNGTIDEVRVYNRVLSEDEIEEHYLLNYNKLVSSETSEDDVFKCSIVPNDGTADGNSLESNTITIEKNVYNITFNITSGEDGSDLTGVYISCSDGWSITSTPTNPYAHKFYEGGYSCEFEKKGVKDYYNKTKLFTADRDKQLNIIMSLMKDMTIQEHNWLASIYECLYNGDCLALDLLEEINETTENLWDQFQPTDESVVIQEDIISNDLSSTQNITINYTIIAPPKAGYSTGDYAPMRIAFWFLDENNECLDQDKVTTDTNRAENTYCIPLIAETLAVVNEEVNFLVELRPNLPEGTYEIVRDIEIDPNEVWIKYGQEIIDSIHVLDSNDNANVFVVKQEPKDVFDEGTASVEVRESSGLTMVTGSATNDAIEETTSEVKTLSGSHIVGIMGMILAFLTIIVVCFTIYKIKIGG